MLACYCTLAQMQMLLQKACVMEWSNQWDGQKMTGNQSLATQPGKNIQVSFVKLFAK